MAYTWKAHNYKVSADVVGKRIEELERQNGVCHPGLLVDDARPVTSPLHEMFEWDDTKAAEAYRVDQARGILHSIRVAFTPGEEPVPAFVHVRTLEEGPGYVGIVRAMSDAEMKAQVLADALNALEAIKKRYDTLAELQPVWEAMQNVKKPARKQRAQRVAVAAR